MSLETPISVRFPPAIKKRLTAIAKRSGVTEAALIRMATDEFLTKVEAAKSITIRMSSLEQDAIELSPEEYQRIQEASVQIAAAGMKALDEPSKYPKTGKAVLRTGNTAGPKSTAPSSLNAPQSAPNQVPK